MTVNLNLRKTGQVSDGHAAGDRLIGIENILGSVHDDTLTGNDRENGLYGGGGMDTLEGGLGADTLEGGLGDDTLDGGAGGDTLDGGAGMDEASYASSYASSDDGDGVTVNLTTGKGSGGDAAGDTLTGIENIRGSAYKDTLIGDGGNNRIEGRAGADIIDGKGNDDNGDKGDWAIYERSDAGVTVNLNLGPEEKQVSGGHADGDTLTGIENIRGSAHDDFLKGDEGGNEIKGGAGDDRIDGLGGGDTLYGEAGDDTLTGGGKKDTINGGDGDDQIIGQHGSDILTGGAGNDVFIFQASDGKDTITDFEVGTDTIHFNTGPVDSFGKLTIKDKGDDAMITWAGADVNSIRLQGVGNISLTMDDFEFL